MRAVPVKVGLTKRHIAPPRAIQTSIQIAIVLRASDRTSRKSKRSKPLGWGLTLESSCSACSSVSIPRFALVYQDTAESSHNLRKRAQIQAEAILDLHSSPTLKTGRKTVCPHTIEQCGGCIPLSRSFRASRVIHEPVLRKERNVTGECLEWLLWPREFLSEDSEL
jgi:hypothetical protein